MVWGASGGLGSYAIQLIKTAGANAIAVISDEDKREFVTKLGAKGLLTGKILIVGDNCPQSTVPNSRIGLPKPENLAKQFGT